MLGINSYKSFIGYTDALKSDRDAFSGWSTDVKMQGTNREDVKLADDTIQFISDCIKDARAAEGSLNTFLGKHWFLGRIFQVFTGRWKDTTKTEAAIDDLFQNLPVAMRDQLDPQGKAGRHFPGPFDRPSGAASPSPPEETDKANQEQDLSNLLRKIDAELNMIINGKEQLAPKIKDEINNIKSIEKKYKPQIMCLKIYQMRGLHMTKGNLTN